MKIKYKTKHRKIRRSRVEKIKLIQLIDKALWLRYISYSFASIYKGIPMWNVGTFSLLPGHKAL